MYVFEDITEAKWIEVERIQSLAYEAYLNETISALKKKAQVRGHLCRLIKDQATKEYCGYVLIHPYPKTDIPSLNIELPASTIDEQENLFLHDFALDPAFSGAGAGRKIIERILNLAKQKQYKSVTLVAVQASSGFWQKMGFQEIKVDKDLSDYGDQAVAMSVDL